MVVSSHLSDIQKLDLAQAVVVCPSDTVLGFHGLFSSPKAIQKIETLKGRRGNFIVLVSNMDEAQSLCTLSQKQLAVLRRYWPGGITFILDSKTPGETIALRLPKQAYVLQMLQQFGGPVVSTSCNKHGEPVIQTLQEAQVVFGREVDLYLDFPTVKSPLPSTLVDLTQNPFQVLRQGEIPFR